MPNCVRCKEPVVSGYVVCRSCADNLKTASLPLDLEYFIDQLAEEIVLDDKIVPCDMCEIGSCDHQVSGMLCRKGVKHWLLDRATDYQKRKVMPTIAI